MNATGTSIAAANRDASGWLCLAATPVFAAMALAAGGAPDTLCSAMGDASPLNGMAAMYLLMSVFHAAPWLKLLGHMRIQHNIQRREEQ